MARGSRTVAATRPARERSRDGARVIVASAMPASQDAF